ncbi:MAG: hypothetical protein Q8P46_04920 [Hyphomicrobiales bacterium]|nr:hypothetical protein [Hyphomicrobiales bacterium]
MFERIFCRHVDSVIHIVRRGERHTFLKQAVDEYGMIGGVQAEQSAGAIGLVAEGAAYVPTRSGT